MTLTVETLARALAKSARAADEWIVRERRRVTLTRELGAIDIATESIGHCFDVALFRDRRQSRGEAVFTLTPDEDDQLETRIAAAQARAEINVGPLWRLPSAAAAARVALADPALVGSPAESLTSVAVSLANVDRRTRIPATLATLETTRKRVRASTGSDHEYVATELRVQATLMVGANRLRTTARFDRRVRRLADLALEAELGEAIKVLTTRAGAAQTPRGRYDLVIADGALRHARRASRAHGWLSPLIAQASGELSRRGLAQYQPGQAVASGSTSGDALTLRSNGTIDYAIDSAPFDEWGGPVRRFAIIDRGRAAKLALSQREAALRGEPANGGVRNPVLDPGKRAIDQLADGKRPRLTITSLSWLESSDATGTIAGEIDLAAISGGADGVADGPTTGGQFSFDLFEVLGRIRLSQETIESGPGAGGPGWIGISDVEIY